MPEFVYILILLAMMVIFWGIAIFFAMLDRLRRDSKQVGLAYLVYTYLTKRGRL